MLFSEKNEDSNVNEQEDNVISQIFDKQAKVVGLFKSCQKKQNKEWD